MKWRTREPPLRRSLLSAVTEVLQFLDAALITLSEVLVLNKQGWKANLMKHRPFMLKKPYAHNQQTRNGGGIEIHIVWNRCGIRVTVCIQMYALVCLQSVSMHWFVSSIV